MPRDNDKNNDSRGRRDRPGDGKGRAGDGKGRAGEEGKGRAGGGKGRSGAARGPEKKFAKRGFAGKSDGERRPYAVKSDGDKPYGKKPYSGSGKPYAGKREGAPPRFNRDDAPRGEKRPTPREDRGDARPAARFSDRKFGDKKPYASRDGGGEKRPYTPRGEGFRKDGDRLQGDRPQGDRPYRARPSRDGDRPRGDRPERKLGGDKKFSRGAPDRGPRKDFGSRDRKSAPGDRKSDRPDRGESKPWQKRDAGAPDHVGRNSRPSRDGVRSFDKPRFEKPRFNKSGEDRGGDPRPRFDRPRQRPEGRTDWQEHPRSEPEVSDRPRRDNEDDSKVFAKRPAFGGRGEYRERKPDFEKRAPRPPREKKSGERIAKVVSRAGLASRREAEQWIVQGRVTVNGRVINSPALDVTANDVVAVDGKPLPPRERTRLFMFHKPRGLMTTHADPEGRPTVFDNLPEGLPRLISIGRLDFNTEGLLLLTNDGGLARALELPDTGWLRRYRVRAHGEVTQAQLDELKKGVEVDGVKYGPIDATLERDQGANVWLVFAIREGKNREVRNVMAHLGLEVNRLIRVSYGPFQLGELAEGEVEEIKTRVLREQLGEKIAVLAGADFTRPVHGEAKSESEDADAPSAKQPFKPAGKSGLIADRKGRRVLVQRTGSEEARARNEAEASGYGPPRRPQRGYHGKRDLKPRDE
jgi:23S rRNA pseudouridine2605 synthase